MSTKFPTYPSVPSMADPGATVSTKVATGTLAAGSIAAKVTVLLDGALDQLAIQIAGGEVSAAVLGELVKLAKTCGVDLTRAGEPMSPAVARVHDALLESLDSISFTDESIN